jgi:hypothetical protein
MIDGRVAAAQMAHGRHHAALMLVVLAGVQQVMLAAVLVLQHHIECLQTPLQRGAGRHAIGLLAVGIGTPVQIVACKVARIGPLAGTQHLMHAGAVAAGGAPKTRHSACSRAASALRP